MNRPKKIIITFCIFFNFVFTLSASVSKQIKALNKIGILEKQSSVGNVIFNYAEGPDNGPVLLMLHAQLLDWYTYHLVLPELSKNFHVFAVDYPGHGKTVLPTDYEMTANQIGSDLALFIEEVCGGKEQKIFVTGNSSGGLLAMWLCSHRPDLIAGAVLEDPPLFSSEYPVVQKTVANKAFTMSYNAVENNQTEDFLMYWVDNGKQFFETYAGKNGQKKVKSYVKLYRFFHPNKPVDFSGKGPSVQEMLRGLDMYNPAFGRAFYTGDWNKDFSHEKYLQKIQCPVLLIQADFDYLEDGTLNGAMSKEMAEKACQLIPDCQYIKFDCSHVTNLEAPELFSKTVIDFLGGIK